MELLKLYIYIYIYICMYTHTQHSWYDLVSKKSAVQRRIPTTNSLDLKYPAVW